MDQFEWCLVHNLSLGVVPGTRTVSYVRYFNQHTPRNFKINTHQGILKFKEEQQRISLNVEHGRTCLKNVAPSAMNERGAISVNITYPAEAINKITQWTEYCLVGIFRRYWWQARKAAPCQFQKRWVVFRWCLLQYRLTIQQYLGVCWVKYCTGT